ncbi:alpha/beta fold hydrolase [Streptomyces sp. NPDC006879]|uniref:alpha/beta fold hydrolase n=1 Tax=Streptomyces sp. NPDC006879 TaxID=3364767 RepID=UPI00367BF633
MPLIHANGVNLFFERVGEGDPLVCVHGSWNDHNSWLPAIEADLRASFSVITYDRRGHGQSENMPGQGTRRQDEDDLAALMEQLDVAPAHVTASSFGASIALGLAARRPELFRSLTLHEPPLVAVVADDPGSLAQLQPMMTSIDAALDHLRKGEDEQGARLFVEEVAFGPGSWDKLPETFHRTLVDHAQTWLDEQSDPDWATLDLDDLDRCTMPVLLSHGAQSQEWYLTVLDRLAEALPRVSRQTIEGAGHTPHITHAPAYVAALTAFIRDV